MIKAINRRIARALDKRAQWTVEQVGQRIDSINQTQIALHHRIDQVEALVYHLNSTPQDLAGLKVELANQRQILEDGIKIIIENTNSALRDLQELKMELTNDRKALHEGISLIVDRTRPEDPISS